MFKNLNRNKFLPDTSASTARGFRSFDTSIGEAALCAAAISIYLSSFSLTIDHSWVLIILAITSISRVAFSFKRGRSNIEIRENLTSRTRWTELMNMGAGKIICYLNRFNLYRVILIGVPGTWRIPSNKNLFRFSRWPDMLTGSVMFILIGKFFSCVASAVVPAIAGNPLMNNPIFATTYGCHTLPHTVRGDASDQLFHRYMKAGEQTKEKRFDDR